MDNPDAADQHRATVKAAQERGRLATLLAYARLSGPGWLQSALSLGGGSLGSSLYLGIIGGAAFLWIQPLAMFLGTVMLCAIGYVTLSINERPLRAINRHINPVLGWSWLFGTLLANMVSSMPQYSLSVAVIEQNFLPAATQGDGTLASGAGKWVLSGLLLVLCTIVTWSYGREGWGMRIYDRTLKLVVAIIVLSFVGVVARIAMTDSGLDFSAVISGLIPKPEHFFRPVESFAPLLEAIQDSEARRYWSDMIVGEQRDIMIAAGGLAVGINTTFLLPYVLLSRGWGAESRGLMASDLALAAFIPFVIATGCVVLAAGDRFHGQLPNGFVVSSEGIIEPPQRFRDSFERALGLREVAANDAGYTLGKIAEPERRVAATLVRRDTFDLAKSLDSLYSRSGGDGSWLSHIVFGVGVLGMTLSSISLMMLISGFAVCEALNLPPKGWPFRLGCLVSGFGVLWPLFSGESSRAWLTVFTGVYFAMLLPIAFLTFFAMMNSKTLLGEQLPRGIKRWVWNVLMGAAVLAASAASVSAIYKKAGVGGLIATGAYVAIILAAQIRMEARRSRRTR
ncbi:divalent metal cation transporter [Botrimarina hoheduenensis]|uniref:Natural resistance-associated macrophage protein n=1 Tax=Botrimarina hoheduenensis TaxID=2528000 RepID=A0A5C5VQE0_9BACT|nr:divalent metal cation transporter [Botrimarina hoheduenensis]TWT40846.1 hypothetical protein Pla111_32640 [Botrimarina hoheduenensis]